MTDAHPSEPRERRTKRRHRSPHGLGRYVTDAELIEWLGVPKDIAAQALHELDRNPRISGFPQKIPIWGDRRYLPAVEQWMNTHYGLKLAPSRRDQ